MIRTSSPTPTPEELESALSHPEAFYEIVDGEIVEKSPMSAFAYLIALRIRDLLSDHARAHGLGIAVHEWVFLLDAGRPLTRRPDAAFVSFERWPADREIPEVGEWEVVPDLAIEILSPNHQSRNLRIKLREYFRYGVRQVWVVHPETREVAVYHSPKKVEYFDEDDTLDGGEILPGLQLPVATLFRRTVGP